MDDIVNACTKDEKHSSGGQLRVEPHVILPGATDDEVMHLLRVALQKPEATTRHDWRYGRPIHLRHLLPLLPLQGFHFSADVRPHLFWNPSRTYRTTGNHDLLVSGWTHVQRFLEQSSYRPPSDA